MSVGGFDLSQYPVHLGRGARIVRLERMDGSMEWYQRYAAQTADDGTDGRMVSMHSFTEPWTSWERHLDGEELVVCIVGTMRLHQEIDGQQDSIELGAGEAAINPPGIWHTADVDAPCTGLFVTAAGATEHRPR